MLAAPCGDDGRHRGARVARPEGSGPFTVDDIEEVTLLARVAGAALDELDEAVAVPTPDELATELGRLAASDPLALRGRRRMVAAAIGHER